MKKLFIEGMSCGHCVKHVKNALDEVTGVSKVNVNLEEKFAIVEGSDDEAAMKAAVEDAGYDVIKFEEV